MLVDCDKEAELVWVPAKEVAMELVVAVDEEVIPVLDVVEAGLVVTVGDVLVTVEELVRVVDEVKLVVEDEVEVVVEAVVEVVVVPPGAATDTENDCIA